MTRVVVLGAGPAGLGAALALAERGFDVRVLEARSAVGGNAGSFELAGMQVDYGSHRLHPAAKPAVLARIEKLLGDDLLQRPRHGRIRLRGRWIHFPLRATDLMLRLPPSFALGVAFDMARGAVRRTRDGSGQTFASVLEAGLGSTICRDFYFPFARKIWGIEPEAISPVQARLRVSGNSFGKILSRLVRTSGTAGATSSRGSFFYPRHGYGQISERLSEVARAAGAHVELEARVTRVVRTANGPLSVEFESAGSREHAEADLVFSTIPITVLSKLLEPSAPREVLDSAERLSFRSLLLVYLVLEMDGFTEFDAHYFPGIDVPFTRISEPKNYSDLRQPAGRTVLCAEIPATPGDENWSRSDSDLAGLVRDGLAGVGLPITCSVEEATVRRLPNAYPVYDHGYDGHFERIDTWLETLPEIVSFGRQGLFAHDNTHHALAMAEAASRCLSSEGRFDREAWSVERAGFREHVVED